MENDRMPSQGLPYGNGYSPTPGQPQQQPYYSNQASPQQPYQNSGNQYQQQYQQAGTQGYYQGQQTNNYGQQNDQQQSYRQQDRQPQYYQQQYYQQRYYQQPNYWQSNNQQAGQQPNNPNFGYQQPFQNYQQGYQQSYQQSYWQPDAGQADSQQVYNPEPDSQQTQTDSDECVDNPKSTDDADRKFWDIFTFICLMFAPLSPAGIYILWKKKISSVAVRIIVTFIIVASNIAFWGGCISSKKTPQEKNRVESAGETSSNQEDSSTEETGQKEDNDISESKAENGTAGPEETVYAPGDTASYSQGTLTLLNYETSSDVRSKASKEGVDYLFLEFEYTNSTTDRHTLSTWIDWEGYVDSYSVDTSIAPNGKNELSGEVAPGMKLKGVVAFKVPKDWKQFDLYFRPDVWGSERLHFCINKQEKGD